MKRGLTRQVSCAKKLNSLMFGLVSGPSVPAPAKPVKAKQGAEVVEPEKPAKLTEGAAAEAGEALTLADLDRAWATRRAIYERTATFFERYDFLVGPTTQVLPFDVDIPYPAEIDGVAFETQARLIAADCAEMVLHLYERDHPEYGITIDKARVNFTSDRVRTFKVIGSGNDSSGRVIDFSGV